MPESIKCGKVRGPNRTIDYFESGKFLYLMRRYARSAKLRDDDPSMLHYPGQSAGFDPARQFFGPESPLSRRAPDVYSIGVQDQDPGVSAGQRLPQEIEAHFEIG